jgi:hypothetical protein
MHSGILRHENGFREIAPDHSLDVEFFVGDFLRCWSEMQLGANWFGRSHIKRKKLVSGPSR